MPNPLSPTNPFSPRIPNLGTNLKFGSRGGSPIAFTFKGTIYFDRSVIRSNWKAINETPLKKAGLLVRKISRNSIKRRPLRYSRGPLKGKGQHSPPGTPPYSHVAGKSPPFKQIYSLPNYFGSHLSTIVGMVGYPGRFPPVPGLHEHGGTARRNVLVPQGRRKLKKGGYGAMTYKRQWRVVRYPARPFMWPALVQAKAAMPQLWANTLTRAS